MTAATSKAKSGAAGEEGLFDAFASRAFTVRVLALACVFLLFAAALGPLLTVYLLHEPERVVIVSEDGTVTIARLQRSREALGLPKIAAGQAARAMLDRTTGGIEDTDAIDLMFSRTAKEKLTEFVKSQAAVFREYGYHQKVEIAATEIAADTDGSYRARVTGQLIRAGVFNDTPKLDRLNFTLVLYFFRNESAVINRQYPLGVWNFDYSESR
jgi:hypothetical protein